jgi:DUF4097 and DUF4098 domain-containing protein YvlB
MSAKKRPSLLAALLWLSLGCLFLLRSFGIGPDVWYIATRYWPVLLILLGLGKVIDYFRQKQGVSLRFGEVFGILVILLVGAFITKVADSRIGEVFREMPIHIGNTSVRPGQWLGTSYRYVDEAKFPVAATTPIKIDNSYGNVVLSAGNDGEVRVRLTKVVYENDEAKAKQIASQIRVEGTPEGGAEASAIQVRTNRDSLASMDYRFNTELEIQVPLKAQLLVRNTFGEVRATGLQGKLDLGTSHNTLDVRDCSADVTASNRFAESRFLNVTGNLSVDARGRVYVETLKGDLNVRNEYSPVEITDVEGKVSVTNTEGRVSVDKVSKPVEIQARGCEVSASRLADSLKLNASHRNVQISEVAANVTLQSQYAGITVKDVKGNVDIESSYDRLNADNIGGSLTVRGKGTSVHANSVGGHVEIASTLKDVTVNNFGDGCMVTNEFGDITLSTPAVGKGDISAKNRNGSIEVFLPDSAGFAVEATARNGNINSDFPALAPIEGPADVWTLKGKAGASGPKLHLETDYSNISLRTREKGSQAAEEENAPKKRPSRSI